MVLLDQPLAATGSIRAEPARQQTGHRQPWRQTERLDRHHRSQLHTGHPYRESLCRQRLGEQHDQQPRQSRFRQLGKRTPSGFLRFHDQLGRGQLQRQPGPQQSRLRPLEQRQQTYREPRRNGRIGCQPRLRRQLGVESPGEEERICIQHPRRQDQHAVAQGLVSAQWQDGLGEYPRIYQRQGNCQCIRHNQPAQRGHCRPQQSPRAWRCILHHPGKDRRGGRKCT